MAVLQYVGARYVPVFYKNPNGSWDWEAGVSYEPLTIVKYGENSYTSRMLVPATVGTPNLYPEFWANTGNYSGYLKEISEKVNFQERLNKRKQSSHWIVIGDSYSLGVLDGGGSTKSWVQFCIEALPDVRIENSGISGGGFTTSPTNFLTSLQGYEADASVTDILVAGGYNDWNSDVATIVAKMNEFSSYAHSAFPNARVHIAYIASDYSSINVRTSLENVVYPAYTSQGNWHVVRNCSCILRDLTGIDIVHPNGDGQAWLGKFFIGYIGSGSDSYTSGLINLKIGSVNYLGRIIDQELHIYVNESLYTEFSGIQGIYGNGIEGSEIGVCEKNALYWMNNQPSSEIAVQGTLQSNNLVLLSGAIYTNNGKWYLKSIAVGDVEGAVQYIRLAVHGCTLSFY